jgi:hypothetical protein
VRGHHPSPPFNAIGFCQSGRAINCVIEASRWPVGPNVASSRRILLAGGILPPSGTAPPPTEAMDQRQMLTKHDLAQARHYRAAGMSADLQVNKSDKRGYNSRVIQLKAKSRHSPIVTGMML